MKRFLALFELTIREQRAIIVGLLIVAAFFAMQTYRERRRSEERTPESIPAQPSPSPGIRP